ncbi:MAG: tyrosine-type recombinase/integrase [Isosphaeraceae bacterium]
MPRTNRPPAYRLHKSRNCAVVTIDGRNHYLGPYGSAESHEKYARLIAESRSNGGHLLPASATVPGDHGPSIGELILAYFRHVQAYYVKDGQPTSEQDNIRQALRFIRQLYGTSPATEFGPMALKKVRQAMIDAGRSRKLINKDVNRIRQMFGWAVENELLPVAVSQALREVKGLRKGRSAARETAPVEPVSEEHMRAILPHLSPQVAAMIQLQHLCGARPQEVISIRPCEIVTDGDVWIYQPRSHKTEHLDRTKVIMLGPKAQVVLRPWLERDPESYCFVPAEVTAWHLRRRRRRQASHIPDGDARTDTPRRAPGQRYTRHSYRVAVQRACGRAGIPVWSPRQLRHTRATLIRQKYGLEAAKAVLGHSDTKITEIYAERDLELATSIMQEIG